MAAVLRDKFSGFQPIGGENHAVAIFLEHTSDEFAYADGIVRDNHDAFVLHAVDGGGGDAALGDSSAAARDNARGACRSLNRFAFAWLAGDHASHIQHQD